MTNEKAIDIFERILSHYQGELYTESEREMKEAFELGKEALETGEIYMNAVDYNLFLEGYKQGKKDFGRPQGEWKSLMWVSGEVIGECPFCDGEQVAENYCSYCGARLHGRN